MDIKKILFKTNTIDAEKSLPDAVIFCNKDGKIQWVNDKAAEIFETSKMHLLTSNIDSIIENALNLISTSIILSKPVITKLKDVDAYYDMTSKEIDEGYVLDFRDAVQPEVSTETDNVDKEISYNKNKFLVKLANDFKSPLQSIVGFSQAMSDGLGGTMTEQQEKYIRIIKKNSSDLMYFVSKLIELSETESDIRKPEYKRFDVVNMINSLVKFNEQLHKDRDYHWNFSVEEGVKNTIVSDEAFVKTILQDVIEVIVKSVETGDINVTISTPTEEILTSKNVLSKNCLMVSVSSSALLLTESDLESMFDPYLIIDTPNRKNLLRAMTLNIVKNILQVLGGVIWVESKILRNTCLSIIIPQAEV